jgi:predicted acetyltransferase
VAFEVRPSRDRAEFSGALYGIWQYFNAPPVDDALDRWIEWIGFDRMHGAFEDGRPVGGAGAFTFDFTVPGGSLPCAGVTVVGVYPTHRRRGILRSLMRAQLDDVHERGEPIAALWASEETIYGRFGYGLASWSGDISVKREWGSFARPLERRGQARFVVEDEAKTLFPPGWEAFRRQRPGVFSRTEAWWTGRVLRTPPEQAATPRRFVALDVEGETQGYAVYKSTPGFEGGVSNAKLDVIEAVGATPQALAEVWRFLLDVDWMDTINGYFLPPDHPIFLLLANPRRARYRRGDCLWMRLVDVGAALSGRSYLADGAVVFEVRDAFCPWNEGRWKLEGGTASRTEDAAEIALDVDALASAYLGAISFAELRAALRIEELAEGAVARADAIFGWRPLPWCPEIF